MTAAQREIALSNLDEQGVNRPMQYDDPGVDHTQLVQTEPDETQRAAAAMAQRAPGKYFLVRLYWELRWSRSLCTYPSW